MKQSFFGQYLVSKGILTREQFIKALELQKQANPKIGELAQREGLLTQSDVEKILNIQRTKDYYFGEIAQDLGLLEKHHIEELLSKQQNNYKTFEEILIENKFLAPDVIKKELEQYALLQKERDYGFDLKWIRENIKDGIIFEIFITQTMKLISRLGDMEVKEGEARFDREYLEDLDIIIAEEIFGDKNFKFLFNVTKNIIIDVANGLMGAQGVYLSDGICLDAGCEFVNVICGNAVTRAGEMGYLLKITPPKVIKYKRKYNYKFPKNEEALVVPILVPEGAVEVAITSENLYKN